MYLLHLLHCYVHAALGEIFNSAGTCRLPLRDTDKPVTGVGLSLSETSREWWGYPSHISLGAARGSRSRNLGASICVRGSKKPIDTVDPAKKRRYA